MACRFAQEDVDAAASVVQRRSPPARPGGHAPPLSHCASSMSQKGGHGRGAARKAVDDLINGPAVRFIFYRRR